jgi:hypothetical protein
MLRAFAEGKRKTLTNSLSASHLYRSIPESVIFRVKVVGADQASAPGVCALPAEAWRLKAETSRINMKKQREFLRNTKDASALPLFR